MFIYDLIVSLSLNKDFNNFNPYLCWTTLQQKVRRCSTKILLSKARPPVALAREIQHLIIPHSYHFIYSIPSNRLDTQQADIIEIPKSQILKSR